MKETFRNLRPLLWRMKWNFETLNRTTTNVINVIVIDAKQNAETRLFSRAKHMDGITINAKLYVPIWKWLITRYLKEIWSHPGKSIEKTAVIWKIPKNIVYR